MGKAHSLLVLGARTDTSAAGSRWYCRTGSTLYQIRLRRCEIQSQSLPWESASGAGVNYLSPACFKLGLVPGD